MPRGSKPGERRGGRKVGTPNKSTADIKAIAGKHGPEAIAEAVRIMKESESDQARMAAIKEILDRAYGKAPQAIIGGGEDDAPVKTIMEIVWGGMKGLSDTAS